MNNRNKVVKGTIVDVDDSERANVILTIECENGETIESSFDLVFNSTRAQNFNHRYGFHVEDSEGRNLNVFTGNRYNPVHILLSYPLRTIGGDTLVSEDTELPVAMN